MGKSASPPAPGQYDAHYGNFETELYTQIRREAFGEDIGQNSWLTSAEQDGFLELLNLSSGKILLDVACGAGGPALRIAEKAGCSVVGIDIHEQAITTANSIATHRGLSDRAEFRSTDATGALPFSDCSFDAITCIDAINHFSDRSHVVADWARMLKVGGRLLFTDPITLTGPLTNAEIAIRSSTGIYLFVPYGYDEHIIIQSGLRLTTCCDITANMAKIAENRLQARASRSTQLREIEGDDTYNSQQDFLTVTANVAKEKRLSRFLYVAEKLH